MTLADRIVVLQAGQIVQVGTPDEIYGSPQHRFVAGFTGSPPMNFLPARLELQGDGLWLHIADAKPLALPAALAQRWRAHAGCAVEFGIRPEINFPAPRGGVFAASHHSSLRSQVSEERRKQRGIYPP